MAVKGGSIVHVGNGVAIIDRVQSGGPDTVNVPTEVINELGNYKSVATVRDVPDLSFSLNSFDVSTEVEQLLTKAAATRTAEDGAMTAADNSLVATLTFTVADVGKQVVVAGAGTGGADLVTTVATFTDATHVELTDPSVGAVTGAHVSLAVNGIDLVDCKPTDFASQWKRGVSDALKYRVATSVALPFLYLESMSYRFGLRDNASQQATLRGDTIFYNAGATFVETAAGSGSSSQTIVTAHAAYASAEADGRRVLAVTADTTRLTLGKDYTETYGSITSGAAVTTVHLNATYATTSTLRIIYASPTTVDYDQSVHPTVAVKPAAVKGRDIEIYIGGYDPNDVPGSATSKVTGVQSVQADWRVQLDKDEEFGNHFAVGQDFEIPTVSGSVEFKPRDPADAMRILRLFQGVSDATKSLGANMTTPLALDVVIKHPDTGVVLKRINVPDARFVVPPFNGQVTQKLTLTVPFQSDTGAMSIFER